MDDGKGNQAQKHAPTYPQRDSIRSNCEQISLLNKRRIAATTTDAITILEELVSKYTLC